MFTENEISILVEIPEILQATEEVKKKFKEKEAELLEISDHDFLALIMMTPAVGIALANGSISLFEELALNKLARKMSKGGYFLKLDPVAHAMKFLIKTFDDWEEEFYSVIRKAMDATFDRNGMFREVNDRAEAALENFARELMGVPYIFVRFLSLFFLHDEVEIVSIRSISKVEHQKVLDIGSKLELDRIPVFRSFCKTFEVK